MILIRNYQKDRTLGALYLPDGSIFSTVELPWRNNARGISCIPEGLYEVGFKKIETPKTLQYQKRFPYFKYHVEIKGVEGREHIYIHIGNLPKDVLGCVAIGMGYSTFGVTQSVKAFDTFYKNFKRTTLKIKSY